MSQSSSALDVDLRSRGLPNQFVLATVVVAAAVFLYTRSGPSVDRGEEAEAKASEEEEVRWVQWVIWLAVRLVQLLFGGAVVMLGVLVTQQRKIIYVPVPPGTQRSMKDNPPMYRSPQAWGLPFEDVMIRTQDGTRINAWLVYQPLANCSPEVPYTLVYFHGNAGNIGHRLENLRDIHSKLRVSILIVDYRAYGDSEDGNGPSERGFLMDAMAAYRWLVDRINNPTEPLVTKMSTERILIFGTSIGGAVGIRLMADLLRERLTAGAQKALPVPAGIILENTFTSLRDMAVQIFPFLSFVSFLLRSPLVFDEWKSSESLQFITQYHEHWCVCLLSGMQDQLVPPAQMVQLHTILKERKKPQVLKFFRFKYGGHNDTSIKGGAEYWTSLQKFMAATLECEEERRCGLSVTTAQLGKDRLAQ